MYKLPHELPNHLLDFFIPRYVNNQVSDHNSAYSPPIFNCLTIFWKIFLYSIKKIYSNPAAVNFHIWQFSGLIILHLWFRRKFDFRKLSTLLHWFLGKTKFLIRNIKKSQIWFETNSSAQSSFQKWNFGNSTQEVQESRYQSFLVLSGFIRFLYFFSKCYDRDFSFIFLTRLLDLDV